MPQNWMDVSDVSFNALLLLERVQLAWFPGWNFPQPALSVALAGNPCVVWFLRHKCPEIADWVDAQIFQSGAEAGQGARGNERFSLIEGASLRKTKCLREAEVAVLRSMVDLLVYALDPAVYDAQPFLQWDTAELTGMVDFADKVVIDVGAGPGRLALTAAEQGARCVYAVEPVGNLRRYLVEKARGQGFRSLYAVDGLITAIPFSDGFADVVMSGHVFGDDPCAEAAELARVTRPGGMIILCPGNRDLDNAAHETLLAQGFAWSVFVEPRDGPVRKYWKRIETAPAVDSRQASRKGA